ncbi:MAG: aminopeptidase N [Pseudomonadota bacterium]
MKDTQPQTIYRKNYQNPDYRINTADLHFELGEDTTLVRAILDVQRTDPEQTAKPLILDGENLELQNIKIDNRPLADSEFSVDEESLKIPDVPGRFQLETEVLIKPQDNTLLMGLYRTSGNFCTQCEAEGFRRITFFLDRPDVMARYTTTIYGDKSRYPVMLSNGNRVEEGELDDGRHWVRWEDPYPKPAYLFALVAGQLECHGGEFVTKSGRNVRLEIWVEPQNIDKCEHALRSLQKSMKWDEEVFGLEYDLDIYMIVAVNDFNMGAMENKGLNVFNSKYVLARPDTATDDDYEGIEGVIAHEYFHNWTGNRVTCRDWFQLTLKEGLTVFRDQQFSGDMTSHAVKRIQDVKILRGVQFVEDSGPMSHPIRPDAYIEMNNFYTATVYEKGAEIIRMYHTLLGEEGFRKGMDLYFEPHDGSAVTCDDFLAAMANANNTDLSQFARWYSQAGTPTVEAEGKYDADSKIYTMTMRQSGAQIDEQGPLLIPVNVGLLGENGQDLPDSNFVLSLNELEEEFQIENIAEPPVPSILRGFSAPVRFRMQRSREELAFLMAHDSDQFNRWEAGQTLAQQVLLDIANDAADEKPLQLDPMFIESFGKVLADESLDGSFKSLALMLPTEEVLGQEMAVINVDALHTARNFALRELATKFKEQFETQYTANQQDGPYTAEQAAIAQRRLKNTALSYLTTLEDETLIQMAYSQFESANNMSDVQAALICLVNTTTPERDKALTAFYEKWQNEPLVVDKWFNVQAGARLPDTLERVKALAEHAAFTLKNPNRVYALVGGFCMRNQVCFHDASGGGYEFLADNVLQLDSLNAQVAARMVNAFNQWRRFDEARQTLVQKQLQRIVDKADLSKDVYEIVRKALDHQ